MRLENVLWYICVLAPPQPCAGEWREGEACQKGIRAGICASYIILLRSISRDPRPFLDPASCDGAQRISLHDFGFRVQVHHKNVNFSHDRHTARY